MQPTEVRESRHRAGVREDRPKQHHDSENPLERRHRPDRHLVAEQLPLDRVELDYVNQGHPHEKNQKCPNYEDLLEKWAENLGQERFAGQAAGFR